LWNKPEITPPSHSNHRPDGTRKTPKSVFPYIYSIRQGVSEDGIRQTAPHPPRMDL